MCFLCGWQREVVTGMVVLVVVLVSVVSVVTVGYGLCCCYALDC